MNSVEPQGIALVSLAVDLTLSFYLHARAESEQGAEPLPKRRRLDRNAWSEQERLEGRLEGMLRGLFTDFNRTLSSTNDLSPNVRLIFRFLREIAIKTPNLSILHGLSDETVGGVK